MTKRTHRWLVLIVLVTLVLGPNFVARPAAIEASVDDIVITESSCSSVTFTAYFTREDNGTWPVQDSYFEVWTDTETLYDDGILYALPLGTTVSLTHSVTFAEQPAGTTITIWVDHGFIHEGFDSMSVSYDCTTGTTVESVPGCDVMVAIPASAVGAAILADTPVYWKPGEASNEVFPAGTTMRAIGVDASGMYTQVLYVCDFYWVPSSAIGPNYNPPWNGAPLPTVVVE